MDKKITVLIYTHNEEKNIVDCIKSAKNLSEQIMVVDMESSDKTVSLAQNLKTGVISFPFSHYVEPARKFGIKQAKSNWVFILDADERISPSLAREIKTVLGNEKNSCYKVPRKNIFGNTWMRHGGWWPDYQIRLINKNFFKDWPERIHSTPEIKGPSGYLVNPLNHNFHGDIVKMVDKTIIFEDIEANLLFSAGKKAGQTIFLRKFTGELFRRLIKKVGFLDGPVGIIESIYQAFSKTITYLFLYEKQKNRPL